MQAHLDNVPAPSSQRLEPQACVIDGTNQTREYGPDFLPMPFLFEAFRDSDMDFKTEKDQALKLSKKLFPDSAIKMAQIKHLFAFLDHPSRRTRFGSRNTSTSGQQDAIRQESQALIQAEPAPDQAKKPTPSAYAVPLRCKRSLEMDLAAETEGNQAASQRRKRAMWEEWGEGKSLRASESPGRRYQQLAPMVEEEG